MKWKTSALKIVRHWWEKLKMTQINGKTFHFTFIEWKISVAKYPCYILHSNVHVTWNFENSNGTFHRKRTKNLKICMEPYKSLNRKAILRKKNRAGGTTTLDLKLHPHAQQFLPLSSCCHCRPGLGADAVATQAFQWSGEWGQWAYDCGPISGHLAYNKEIFILFKPQLDSDFDISS